jgi:hypothetical protein
MQLPEVFIFFVLRQAYIPNGNSHVDQNASIDADFLKEVPFGGAEVCKENCRVKFDPKIERNFQPFHKHEILE